MRVVYQGILDDIVDVCTAAEEAGKKVKRIYLTEPEESILKEEMSSTFIKMACVKPKIAGDHLGVINGVPIWREVR